LEGVVAGRQRRLGALLQGVGFGHLPTRGAVVGLSCHGGLPELRTKAAPPPETRSGACRHSVRSCSGAGTPAFYRFNSLFMDSKGCDTGSGVCPYIHKDIRLRERLGEEVQAYFVNSVPFMPVLLPLPSSGLALAQCFAACRLGGSEASVEGRASRR
jgi:hypothetical protein